MRIVRKLDRRLSPLMLASFLLRANAQESYSGSTWVMIWTRMSTNFGVSSAR